MLLLAAGCCVGLLVCTQLSMIAPYLLAAVRPEQQTVQTHQRNESAVQLLSLSRTCLDCAPAQTCSAHTSARRRRRCSRCCRRCTRASAADSTATTDTTCLGHTGKQAARRRQLPPATAGWRCCRAVSSSAGRASHHDRARPAAGETATAACHARQQQQLLQYGRRNVTCRLGLCCSCKSCGWRLPRTRMCL